MATTAYPWARRLQVVRQQLAPVQVDTLFSTVGSNPLPIAVTARLVLREGGHLVLVHTAGTRRCAEALHGVIGPSRDGCRVSSFEVPDSDPAVIYSTVQQQVPRLAPSGAVGVDFTGGTKAMSVFVSTAATAALGSRPHFSYYLDDRRDLLHTVCHRDGGQASGPQAAVGLQPVLLPAEVLLLHGQIPINALAPPRPQLAQTTQVLAQVYAKWDPRKAWCAWLDRLTHYETWQQVDRQRQRLTRDTPQPDRDGQERPGWDWGAWPTKHPLLGRLRESLQAESGVCCAPGVQPADFTAALGWAEGEFVDWLRGKWLEDHTYAAIAVLPPELGLRPHGVSVHCELVGVDASGTAAMDPETRFEVDVLATRGYRLWGCSCTTSGDRKLCKTKLFEAAQRFRQLGGGAARVILVCGATNAGAIEKQTQTLFQDHNQPWVAGAAALPDLAGWLHRRLAARCT
ncbi:MAG: hypothetical protein IT204_24450 [Fimbriimonadaceae bacterium]|nr:hypothetical protein [Fimbriimonadaceae bacterium]